MKLFITKYYFQQGWFVKKINWLVLFQIWRLKIIFGIFYFCTIENVKILFKNEKKNNPYISRRFIDSTSVPKLSCKISIRQFWCWMCTAFWKTNWSWQRHNKGIHWYKLANNNCRDCWKVNFIEFICSIKFDIWVYHVFTI